VGSLAPMRKLLFALLAMIVLLVTAGITLTPRQVTVGRAGHVPARTLAGRLRFTVQFATGG
jgi:hypothetical protein